MKKTFLIIFALALTAQSCSFLGGGGGSGSQGVFLSTDSGDTWQESNNLIPEGTLSKTEIFHLYLEKQKPSIILASGIKKGLFVSDNAGESWFSVLSEHVVYDALVNPINEREIFAAGTNKGMASVVKSSDSGKTWIQVYSEPRGESLVASIAIDPNRPNVLYAGLSSGTIIRSVDGGETWSATTDVEGPILHLFVANDSYGTIYGVSKEDGFLRSADGGITWNTFQTMKKNSEYNDMAIDPQNPAVVFLGTSEGMFRSDDSGNNWAQIVLPTTPEIKDVSAVAVNPKNNHQIFAAINSTIFRSDDDGATWRTVSLSTERRVSEITINNEEPNRIYVGLR